MMDVYIEIKSNPAAEKQTNSLLMLKFNPGDFIFHLVLKSLAQVQVLERSAVHKTVSLASQQRVLSVAAPLKSLSSPHETTGALFLEHISCLQAPSQLFFEYSEALKCYSRPLPGDSGLQQV